MNRILWLLSISYKPAYVQSTCRQGLKLKFFLSQSVGLDLQLYMWRLTVDVVFEQVKADRCNIVTQQQSIRVMKMENLYHLVLPTTVYNCLTIKYCELMGGFSWESSFKVAKQSQALAQFLISRLLPKSCYRIK